MTLSKAGLWLYVQRGHRSGFARLTSSGGFPRALAILLSLFALFFCTDTRAQGADVYLKEMPSAAQVRARVSDSDAQVEMAKQAGAFVQLRKIVHDLSEGRVYTNDLTALEKQWAGIYLQGFTQTPTPQFDASETARLGWESPRGKWYSLRSHFETSEEFRDELLGIFFTPTWREHYADVLQRQLARRTANENPAESAPPAEERNSIPDAAVQSTDSALDQQQIDTWKDNIMNWIVSLIIMGLLYWLIRQLIRTYNALGDAREHVYEARSNVKVVIDRRCAAINTMAQLAESYAANEQFTQLKVSKDSTLGALSAAYQESGALLQSVQHVAEKFPNLKHGEHFARLQSEVSTCEQTIQEQRQVENRSVANYNRARHVFPIVMFANLFNFKREAYIDLDVSEARTKATALSLSGRGEDRLSALTANELGALQLAVAPVAGTLPPPQPTPVLSQAAPARLVSSSSPPSASQLAARGGGTTALAAMPMFSLRFLSGPLGGRSLPIGMGIVVGREPPADVVVSDQRVSSAHAWIGPKSGNPAVFIDRGSTNGSHLNGNQVTAGDEHPIQEGDVISLGAPDGVSFTLDRVS